MSHEKLMKAARAEAEKGFKKDEVPVGAVVAVDGKIIARAHNLRESLADPTAHAEILALKKAGKKLGSWRLNKAVLYTTLEPCLMCAGAVVHSRIKELVYGADDPKAGACGSVMNIISSGHLDHRVKVTSGIMKAECSKILKKFFKRLRVR
ncbi:MAG: tRNA adenosine(34) deaminase TadA [bacterium]